MLFPSTQECALEYLKPGSCPLTQATLERWQRAAEFKQWHRTSRAITELIQARTVLLENLEKGILVPPLGDELTIREARAFQWVVAKDLRYVDDRILLKVLNSFPEMDKISLLAYRCASAVSTARTNRLIASDIPTVALNTSAADIFSRWNSDTTAAQVSPVAERIQSHHLKRLLHSRYQEARTMATQILHARNLLLLRASRSKGPPIENLPWCTEEDICRVHSSKLEGALIANAHLSPNRMTEIIAARQCNELKRMSVLAKILCRSKPTVRTWALARAAVNLWRDPSQQPAYDHLFRTALSPGRIILCRGERPSLESLGTISMLAAAGPHPVPLMTTLVSSGFPLHHGNNNGLFKMRHSRRRVTEETQEATRGRINQSALAWLCHVCPSKTLRAIRAGHRIRRPEYDEISDTIPSDVRLMVKGAIIPMRWSPSTHTLFPRSARALVTTTITAAKKSVALPQLPTMVWVMVMEHVYGSTETIAQGWA
jgi:hypothetical protein